MSKSGNHKNINFDKILIDDRYGFNETSHENYFPHRKMIIGEFPARQKACQAGI